MIKLSDLINEVAAVKARSAWNRGVKEYAIVILEFWINENDAGIDNWRFELFAQLQKYPIIKEGDYWRVEQHGYYSLNEALKEACKVASYGGSWFIYDPDIAQILSSKSFLKLKDNGAKQPSKNETWLDYQGRALYEAIHLISAVFGQMKTTKAYNK